MKHKNEIIKILKNKIMILDGATGTELQKRGMPAGVCPELWAIENPDVQNAIYKSYADAGSDIIYTCTFGANQSKLEEYGEKDVEGVNRKLTEMAREAAGDDTLVAGDIGPTGHFIKPFGDVEFDAAVESCKRQVRGLIDGGADLFVIETQMDIQEARAALLAVKETDPNAFTIVTMTYEPDGRTLNGTSPEAALITLQSLGADAVGCNCSTGPVEMLEVIKRIKKIADIPLVAKPNAGMPKIVDGKTVFPMDEKEFASYAEKFRDAGVNLIGGCCGTSPLHIKELSSEMDGKKPLLPPENGVVCFSLSSSREAVLTWKNSPLRVIGERINPTGKKKLQAELKENKFTIVRKFALEQRNDGASFLDINAGMPGIDEKKTMLKLIDLLAPQTDLPLVIDSSDISVIETALRYYPGRALINSISGEKEKLEKLLPVAAKYGAMFILLPLTDDELPAKAEKRVEIIKDIYGKAEKLGFRRQDILVDGLVMTVSSKPEAAKETLKTISWAAENRFGAVAGLSNISFGLPERGRINATFLSMAAYNGLTHIIANPANKLLMEIKSASDLLTEKDKDAAEYIAYCQKNTETAAEKPAEANISPVDEVRKGIIEGIRDDITDVVQKALDEKLEAPYILEKVMIPAIIHVGELYDKKKYFLPQLIASAETMKKGFQLLEPMLNREEGSSKGKILFATVEGDIHDIGKNIVVLMMKNFGFEVIDLGKDISTDKIIKEAKIHKPQIIALSALMTTTMVKMPEVMKLAEKEGIDCPFMIGGAVVTREWANSIGANYSKDGVEAIKVAEKLLSI
jgi:5-methyltetrahydrofolate--homocysteine methyltransferase